MNFLRVLWRAMIGSGKKPPLIQKSTPSPTKPKKIFDPNHPFFEKTVVFTCVMEGMERWEAELLVEKVGGFVHPRVTQTVDFLIVGDLESHFRLYMEKSVKLQTAEKYRDKGRKIRILNEHQFYDLLEMKAEVSALA